MDGMGTTNRKAGISARVGRCEMPEYIPKGGLCMNCANFRRDCSRLDFTKMHVIKIYPDGVKAVKCTEYHKGKQHGIH